MTTHTFPGGAIVHTTHVYPPIPIRSFDWSAHFDGYDGAPDAGFQPIGSGATEQEAIDDLFEQQRMHDEDVEQERADNGQFGVGA